MCKRFLLLVYMVDNELLYDIIEYNIYKKSCFNNYISFNHISTYDKILNARIQKNLRIKKKLLWLINHSNFVYFCTFTFDDYYIDKSERTKRDLIKNSLFSFDPFIKIILNKDYGKQTEREHYHAIIGTKSSCDLSLFLKLDYPCFSDARLVNTSKDDIKRLTKYINKLSNHCMKDTTKHTRLYCNFKGYDNLSKEFYILAKKRLGL